MFSLQKYIPSVVFRPSYSNSHSQCYNGWIQTKHPNELPHWTQIRIRWYSFELKSIISSEQFYGVFFIALPMFRISQMWVINRVTHRSHLILLEKAVFLFLFIKCKYILVSFKILKKPQSWRSVSIWKLHMKIFTYVFFFAQVIICMCLYDS